MSREAVEAADQQLCDVRGVECVPALLLPTLEVSTYIMINMSVSRVCSAGQSAVVRKAIKSLPDGVGETIALTVVEMGGEFGFQPTEISCLAVQPSQLPKVATHVVLAAANATAVRTARFIHSAASGSSVGDAVAALANATTQVHTTTMRRPLAGLVECEVYLRRAADAAAMRSALSAIAIGAAVAPVLTIVLLKDGLFARSELVSLHCTSTIDPAGKRAVFAPSASALRSSGSARSEDRGGAVAVAVVSDGLVFLAGVDGTRPDALDALSRVGAAFEASKTQLNETLLCRFFQADPLNIEALASGFFDVFNNATENFLHGVVAPPTRVEFVAKSGTCGSGSTAAVDGGGSACEVLVKCIAALPAN